MKLQIDAFFEKFMHKVDEFEQILPEVIGTEVVNSTLDNFKDEAFFGEKWRPRKSKKNTKRILVDTGILRRSVTILRSQPGLVVVGSEVPYARVHNDGGVINRAARSETFTRNRHQRGKLGKMFGGMGAFRKGTITGQGQTYKTYTINMPARKFLGDHPNLRTILMKAINTEQTRIFK